MVQQAMNRNIKGIPIDQERIAARVHNDSVYLQFPVGKPGHQTLGCGSFERQSYPLAVDQGLELTFSDQG
jgi:hypothetical protein